MLEELKAAYGKDYTLQLIHIGEGVQKDKWFTELGPNGRIPVLVDHDNGSVALMEGQAILQYLARKYDPGEFRVRPYYQGTR
jgi:glutathione S-transferase